MNHDNGQIIAMASYPTFDNRWMESGISGTKYKQLFPSKNPDGTQDRPRPVDPRQPCRAGQLQPRLHHQAVHRLVGACTSASSTPNTVWKDEGTYTLDSRSTPASARTRAAWRAASSRTPRTSAPTCPARTARSPSATRSPCLSDTFFYHLGEQFWQLCRGPARPGEPAQGRTSSGSASARKTGIQLPFEWKGRVPDDAVKTGARRQEVLAKGEVPRLVVGDNVQVAIGQGLMAATPLQLADAYATLANGGFLLQPTIVKAIWAPLTPDASPAVADLAAGTIVPVVRQARRARPAGDAARGARAHRRRPAPGDPRPGRDLRLLPRHHRRAAVQGLPGRHRRQDRHGAGRGQPAVERLVGVRRRSAASPTLPYTVVAYLEKSGYGSKAAAPVTKCMFLALVGQRRRPTRCSSATRST